MHFRTRFRPAEPDVSDLARLPLFRSLTPVAHRALSRDADRSVIETGDTLLRGGATVHWVAFVVDGRVIEATDDPRSWRAGDPVGLAEGLARQPAPMTVIAVAPTKVLLIEVRRLTAAIATDPELGMAVARELACQQVGADRLARRGVDRRRVGMSTLRWA